jgi:hypothetical protein
VGQYNPQESPLFLKNSPKSGISLQKTAGFGFIILYEMTLPLRQYFTYCTEVVNALREPKTGS